MFPQRKIAAVLIVLILSISLAGGLSVFANNDIQYKTFQSENFGFSISYPESWEKVHRDEEGRPQIYQHTYLRVSSTTDPKALVTVMVNKLGQPTSLNELKQYLELRGQLFSQNGLEEVDIGEFADSRAVIANYTHTSINRMTIKGETGPKETEWVKSKWKGQLIRVINNGYFYRINTSSPLEEFEEANEKYLSRILDSFEFKK